MSYDVNLAVDVGGEKLVDLDILDTNYTWNVAPMFHDVLGYSITTWDGELAAEVVVECNRILDAFAAEPEKYEAMNPENGWGDFEGAGRFISTIRDACIKAPRAIVKVW